jgi:alpha-glucosidase (family GH31 glycosyl hydrolase)
MTVVVFALQAYWSKQIKQFYDLVHNDGMWIDMNEVKQTTLRTC